MRLHVSGHSRAHAASFLIGVAVLLAGFVVLVNVGYLMAQSIVGNASQVLQGTMGGREHLRNLDWFLFVRNSAIIPSFGVAILVFIVLALGHFFTFGPKDVTIQGPDDAIPWWTLTDRILHWIVAIAFLLLMVTGLSLSFGRYLGGGTTQLVMRMTHEYAGFVYGPVLVIMALKWIGDALFRRYDWAWLTHVGGYMGYKGPLTSGKFNAGQKIYYWVMAIAGILFIWTGFSLYFGWGGMAFRRFYVLVHFASTVPMVLMFIVHLYLSTLGTKGIFMVMIHGKFSKRAATDHYSEAPEFRRLGASAPRG